MYILLTKADWNYWFLLQNWGPAKYLLFSILVQISLELIYFNFSQNLYLKLFINFKNSYIIIYNVTGWVGLDKS